MFGIQLLSLTFILVMLYLVRIHYKKGELPKIEAYGWSLGLLILAVIIAIKPTADLIRHFFDVTRLMDVLVTVALMGVFVFMIENRIQINKLRLKLERIVRDKALHP